MNISGKVRIYLLSFVKTVAIFFSKIKICYVDMVELDPWLKKQQI